MKTFIDSSIRINERNDFLFITKYYNAPQNLDKNKGGGKGLSL